MMSSGVRRRRSTLAGIAAIVATCAIWSGPLMPVNPVQALPPGSAPATGQRISPASGNASTAMTFRLSAGDNSCPGDTASGNYRWNMYVAAAGVDPATVTWTPGASGGPFDPTGGFVQTLFTSGGGVGQLSRITALGTGQVVDLRTVDFLSNTIPGDGTYKLGISCTRPPALGQPAQTERFWMSTIAITGWAGPTQFDWAVLDPVVYVDPTPGLSMSASVGTADTPFTLAEDTTICPGDTSNFGIRWHAFIADPAVDPARLDISAGRFLDPGSRYVQPLYSIGGAAQIEGVTTGSGRRNGATTMTLRASGIPGNGTYTVGVLCTDRVGSSPRVVRFWPLQLQVLNWVDANTFEWFRSGTTSQTVAVSKSGAGGLILTQRCGTYGVLPQLFDADVGFMPAESAVDNGATPSATCGIEMRSTAILDSSPLAGRFTAALGRINQLIVTDTRSSGLPWTVSAAVGDFTNGGTSPGDSFTGNLLGWYPTVSGAAGADGSVDGLVTAGPWVFPSADPTPAPARTLASAQPGKTAVLVQLDARLELFIPVDVNDGRYDAQIVFTLI